MCVVIRRLCDGAKEFDRCCIDPGMTVLCYRPLAGSGCTDTAVVLK